MQKTKGFTLIELLVVIAIIGILSGLIIVSMSNATGAAKDARIKAAMDQLRSTAEVFKANSSTGIYGTAISSGTGCPSSGTNFLYGTGGADGAALCLDIQAQTATAATFIAYIDATTTAPKYCVQKTLNSGSIWCVDSSGFAGITTGTCTTSYDCL
ncbi:MAG: type II secretion system protein [Candidatus Paceibacterota bacterium]|jgi:prepilin-type N-terminal cleavage/methylation domain-containing protein